MNYRELKKYSLLSEVAGEYYEFGMSEDEISKQLCISRTRISRLLKEAKEKGIVKITVNYELERVFELEERLKERYNLTDVRVLNNRNKSTEEIYSGVEKLAADLLWDTLEKDIVIGTSWGTTLSNVVQKVHYAPFPLQIVQLMGSVPCKSPSHTPQGVVADLARNLGCRGSFLNVPLYIENDTARKFLTDDANNRRVLNQGLFSDIILTSVGSLTTIHEKDFWREYMTDVLLEEILQKGGVGSVFGRFYDANGKELDCKWNERLVTITLDQIKSVPNVMVISYGKDKINALQGALNGGIINSLIVDGKTAATILQFKTTDAS